MQWQYCAVSRIQVFPSDIMVCDLLMWFPTSQINCYVLTWILSPVSSRARFIIITRMTGCQFQTSTFRSIRIRVALGPPVASFTLFRYITLPTWPLLLVTAHVRRHVTVGIVIRCAGGGVSKMCIAAVRTGTCFCGGTRSCAGCRYADISAIRVQACTVVGQCWTLWIEFMEIIPSSESLSW